MCEYVCVRKRDRDGGPTDTVWRQSVLTYVLGQIKRGGQRTNFSKYSSFLLCLFVCFHCLCNPGTLSFKFQVESLVSPSSLSQVSLGYIYHHNHHIHLSACILRIEVRSLHNKHFNPLRHLDFPTKTLQNKVYPTHILKKKKKKQGIHRKEFETGTQIAELLTLNLNCTDLMQSLTHSHTV